MIVAVEEEKQIENRKKYKLKSIRYKKWHMRRCQISLKFLANETKPSSGFICKDDHLHENLFWVRKS